MSLFLGFFTHLDHGTWLIIGILLMFTGFIWGIFAAYKEDVRWGRWTLLVPVLTLYFCATHPRKGLPPLILQLVGAAIFLKAGLSLMPVN
jgi:hypothetical protein